MGMDPKMYPSGSSAVKSADTETTPTVGDLIATRDATNTLEQKWISVLNLIKKMVVSAKAADATLTANESGQVITTTGATGAVVLTLPSKASGLWYLCMNTVDQNMTITSDAVDTIVTTNDVAADSVAFSTTSEKIGAAALVVCDGSKWIVIPLNGTATVAT